MLSPVGGMERWGYVFVGPEAADSPPKSKRDGWGSSRGLRQDWVVRLTPAGRKAREIWQPLFDDIESRWVERFGASEITELRQSLQTSIETLEVELPEYLPIVGSANGMVADIPYRERHSAADEGDTARPHLSTLLAQVLLAYTIDFERESDLSLTLSANFLRVLDETALDARRLPFAAGVSKEATSMALRFLTKSGHVTVDRAKQVRLTPKGREAQEAARLAHGELERAWKARIGARNVRHLRSAVQALLDQRDGDRARLALGLQPHPDGWRASNRYIEQTNAVIADPIGRLPHYPMVLHRGGWPDGS